jgi:hypothetical protein
VLREVAWRLDDDGWTTWNLSRSSARDVLGTLDPVPAADC